MKKYINISENSIIYMGRTADIKAMYKSIARASRKCHTNFMPLFSEMPKFSENKITYGIEIDEDYFISIISSDVFTAMLLADEVVEVED